MFLECGTALATKPCSVVIYRLADEKKPEVKKKKYQLSFKLANDYLRLCEKNQTQNFPVANCDSAQNTVENAAFETPFMKQSKRNRVMPSAIENGVNNTDCSNNAFPQNDKDSKTSMENGHLWKKAFLEERPPPPQANVATLAEFKEGKVKDAKRNAIETANAAIKVNIKPVLKNNANTPKEIGPEKNKTSDMKVGIKRGNGLTKARDVAKINYLINSRADRKRELINTTQSKIFNCKRTLSSLKRKWSYGPETRRKRLLEPQYEIAKAKDDDATKNSTRIILKTRKTTSSAGTVKPKIEKAQLHQSNTNPEAKAKKVSPLTVYAKLDDNQITEVSCKRYRKRNKRKAKTAPSAAPKEVPVDFNVLYSVLPRHESVAVSVRETMDFLIKEVLRKSSYSNETVPFDTVSDELRDLVFEFCVANDYVYDDFRNLGDLLTYKVIDGTKEQTNPETKVKRRRRVVSSPVDSEEDDNYDLLSAMIRSRPRARTLTKCAAPESNVNFDVAMKQEPFNFVEECVAIGAKLRLSSSDSDTLPANNSDADYASEVNYAKVKVEVEDSEEVEDAPGGVLEDCRPFHDAGNVYKSEMADSCYDFESEILSPLIENEPIKAGEIDTFSDNNQNRVSTYGGELNNLDTQLPTSAANINIHTETSDVTETEREEKKKEYVLSNLDLNCDVSNDSDTDHLVICFDNAVSESNGNNAEKSDSPIELSYTANEPNLPIDDYDAQSDSFSRKPRTAKTEVPKFVATRNTPLDTQVPYVSEKSEETSDYDNDDLSKTLTENSMPLLKDLIKPLDDEETPIELTVETNINSIGPLINEEQINKAEQNNLEKSVTSKEPHVTTENVVVSEELPAGANVASNSANGKRGTVDDSILRTLLQESPPEDFNIFMEQTANSMNLFENDPKLLEITKYSNPGNCGVQNAGKPETNTEVEEKIKQIVNKESSVAVENVVQNVVSNNETTNESVEEKKNLESLRCESPEIVELGEIVPTNSKKKKNYDFGDNHANMTLEDMIKVLEKDIENLEKMTVEKQKELLLIDKYKTYKENLLKSLIKSRKKPYVPRNLPFPVLMHSSPNNKMTRSISNGELNKSAEQKESVSGETPNTSTKTREDQNGSSNIQKETCLVRPLVREAKATENPNSGSVLREDRNILETRKTIPMLSAVTTVNILPKPIYPALSLNQPLPLPIQLAIASRSGFQNSSVIPVTHPSSSHRSEKPQMKQVNETAQRLLEPAHWINEVVHRMNDPGQRINDTAQRINETVQKMNEQFHRFNQTARRVNQASPSVNESSPALKDSAQRLNDPAQRMNEAPQRIHETLPRTNEAPQRMNEALNKINEAPNKINEAPHRMTEAPHRMTEVPHRMTGAPHRMTEGPHRTTEAPHRTTEAPHRTTEAPHRTTEAPHRTTEAPHRTTEAAHRTTEAAHRMTEAPHRMTEAPHRMTEAPHRMTEAPHRMTEAPHRMTEAPHRMAEAPHRMAEAPHRMVEAPHRMAEVPHRMVEAPHRMAVVPHRLNEVPHRLNEAPHRLNEAPHRVNEAPHRVNEAPHRVNEAPHRVNEAPHRLNEAPHRMNEAPHRMNEAPHRMNEAPHRMNEAPHRMNEAPHRMNEAPHRLNEAPHRMTGTPHRMTETPHWINEAVRKNNEPAQRTIDPTQKINESVQRKNDSPQRINENRTAKVASDSKNSPSPIDSKRGFQPYNTNHSSSRCSMKPKLPPEKPPNRTLPMMLMDTPSSDFPNYGRNATVPSVPNAFNDGSKQNPFKGSPNKPWPMNEQSYSSVPKEKHSGIPTNKVNINPDILKNSFLNRESSLSELAYNLAISLKEAQICLTNNPQPVATSSANTLNVKSTASPVKSGVQDSPSLKMQLQNIGGIPYDFYQINSGQAAIPIWPYVPFVAAPTANIAPFQYPGLDTRPVLPSAWESKEKPVVPELRSRENVQLKKNTPNVRGNQNVHLDLKNIRFRKCMVCNQADAQFICSGCGKDWYCSVECQRENWKSHSRVCSS